MKPRIHELKTVPPYFEEVATGRKTFEVRINDRGFKVGDKLILFEWKDGRYTHRHVKATISYILDDSFPGLTPGYVAMALSEVAIW